MVKWHCLFGVLLLSTFGALSGQELKLRNPVIKPAHFVIDDNIHRRDMIQLKFVDGLDIRLVGQRLIENERPFSSKIEELSSLVGNATFLRSYSIEDEELAALQNRAEETLGREMPDLRLCFNISLSVPSNTEEMIDRLNGLAYVEYAMPMLKPVPLPFVAPDFVPSQDYMLASPVGINAPLAWTFPGGKGGNIKIVDVEYAWNLNHLDLPSVSLLGPTPVSPFPSNNHGTAVLGEMAGLDDGIGVRGICSDASFFVSAASTASGYDVGAAIMATLTTVGPGDVILIEQQAFGPAGGAYVPVEWNLSTYNAIIIAVGNGVNVVEAAGNGNQDLDAPIFSMGNFGHYPFLPGNDSGAILVGAGAAQGGSSVNHSRLSFSNYGSTVDLSGQGELVVTTGYGGLFTGTGANEFYTQTFSGTSSSSPIVAGAVAIVQGVNKAHTGTPLTPAMTKSILQATGTPQASGTFPVSQNIGPFPDVSAAIALLNLSGDYIFVGGDIGELFGAAVSCAGDVNGDGFDDIIVGGLRNGAQGVDSGRCRIFSGADRSELYSFDGDSAGDQMGASVSGAGDVNGDGFDDVIVGAPNNGVNGAGSGSAYVFSGLDGSVLYSLDGDSAGDSFGNSVSGVGDMNGDGFADFVVGARSDDNFGNDSGSVTIYSGSDGSVLYFFDGDSVGERFGVSVSGAGDINGDGVTDVIVGAPADANNGVDAGSITVLSGFDGSVLIAKDGDSAGDAFGRSVSGAGDVNADGFDDFIVGAMRDDNNGLESGSAKVFSGFDGSLLYSFDGDSAGDGFGRSVSDAGDVNGDGFSDFIVGAAMDDNTGTNSGSVRVFSGIDGSLLSMLDGATAGEKFGRAVSSAGDVNGDGFADVLVGAPFSDVFGTDVGMARVFFSDTLPVMSYSSVFQSHRLKLRWIPDANDPQSLTGTISCTAATPGSLGVFGISLAPADLLIFGFPLLIANDAINLLDTGALGYGFMGDLTIPGVSRHNVFLAGSQIYIQLFESSPTPSSSNALRMLLAP